MKSGPIVFIKKEKGPNWGHAVTSATVKSAYGLIPASAVTKHRPMTGPELVLEQQGRECSSESSVSSPNPASLILNSPCIYGCLGCACGYGGDFLQHSVLVSPI